MPTLNLHAHHGRPHAGGPRGHGAAPPTAEEGPVSHRETGPTFPKLWELTDSEQSGECPSEKTAGPESGRPVASVCAAPTALSSGPRRGSLVLRARPPDDRPAAPWRSHSRGWLASTRVLGAGCFTMQLLAGHQLGKPEADQDPKPSPLTDPELCTGGRGGGQCWHCLAEC